MKPKSLILCLAKEAMSNKGCWDLTPPLLPAICAPAPGACALHYVALLGQNGEPAKKELWKKKEAFTGVPWLDILQSGAKRVFQEM